MPPFVFFVGSVSMRLFDPPFIPDFGILPRGGLLPRSEIPVIGRQLFITKAENLVSGDIIKITSSKAIERLMERREQLRKR